MTASRIAGTPSEQVSSKPVFWELLWQSAGIQAVVLFVIADALRGRQPKAGASADALVAFYAGHHTGIIVAAIATGLGVLNLMWFAAALRTTFADLGKDGWGGAATASSAAFGGLWLLSTAIVTALSYSVAAAENRTLLSGLNEVSWALLVLTAFPRAMLIMSMAFGLWRAQLISNALFAVGVGFVVLGVLSGTTWSGGGFWAPDGDFAHVVSTCLLPAWVVIVSWVLFNRRPTARVGW